MALSKKRNFALIFSSISIFISLLALLLSYISYYDSKSTKFIWEVELDASIPTTIQYREAYWNDSLLVDHYLTIWIQCDITNTGNNVFSVNSIVTGIYDYQIEHLSQYSYEDWHIYKPSPLPGNIPEDRFTVPFVVESGHTKRVIDKIDLRISEKLYEKLKLEFEDKNLTFGDIRRLSNDVQELKKIEEYIISFEVRLSNGKKRQDRINLSFYNW